MEVKGLGLSYFFDYLHKSIHTNGDEDGLMSLINSLETEKFDFTSLYKVVFYSCKIYSLDFFMSGNIDFVNKHLLVY